MKFFSFYQQFFFLVAKFVSLVFCDSHRLASQNAARNLEINEGFAWLHLRLPPPLNTDGPTSDGEQRGSSKKAP